LTAILDDMLTVMLDNNTVVNLMQSDY
jgi:hypothetical protein